MIRHIRDVEHRLPPVLVRPSSRLILLVGENEMGLIMRIILTTALLLLSTSAYAQKGPGQQLEPPVFEPSAPLSPLDVPSLELPDFTDLQLPEFPSNPSPSAPQPVADPCGTYTADPLTREGQAELYRYQHCGILAFRDNPNRTAFDGEAALIKSAANWYSSMASLTGRQVPLPPADAWTSWREDHPQFEAQQLNLMLYRELSFELALTEFERQFLAPASQHIREQGQDPATEAARIALGTRLDPVVPWFAVTEAQITGSGSDVIEAARRRFVEAERDQVRAADALRQAARSDYSVLRRAFDLIQQHEASYRRALTALEGADVDSPDTWVTFERVSAHHTEVVEARLAYEAARQRHYEMLQPFTQRLNAAIEEHNAAQAAWVEAAAGRGAGIIERITGPTSEYTAFTADEIRRAQQLLPGLERELAERRADVPVLEAHWDNSKQNFANAVQVLTRRTENASTRAWVSTFAQLYIETGFATIDLVRAFGQGGPGGLLVEIIQQNSLRHMFPPAIYHVSHGRLQSDENGENTEIAEEPELMLPGMGETFISQGAREGSNIIARRALRMEEQAAAQLERREIRSLLDAAGESVSVNALRRRERAAQIIVSNTMEGLGQLGIRAMARTMLADAGVSLAQEALKEGAKLAIARVIEMPEAQALLEAELYTRQMFNVRRQREALMEDNQRAIERLATRIANLRYIITQGAMHVTAEEPQSFFADSRAEFQLHLAPGARLPEGFNPTVRLGDVTLVRDQFSTDFVYHIPGDAEFPTDGTGYLPLTVELN